jgi:hypothetical protein
VHQTRGRILDSDYAAGKLLKELLNVKLALPGIADAVRTHREALSQFSRPQGRLIDIFLPAAIAAHSERPVDRRARGDRVGLG